MLWKLKYFGHVKWFRKNINESYGVNYVVCDSLFDICLMTRLSDACFVTFCLMFSCLMTCLFDVCLMTCLFDVCVITCLLYVFDVCSAGK